MARNADLPFRVQARGCTFTVLGTRFNISAYDEDPDVLAALMEGSLQFESSRSTETMVPGDLITYDCRTMGRRAGRSTPTSSAAGSTASSATTRSPSRPCSGGSPANTT